MDSRPLFSVVLPTLGRSEYLGEAIQSVLVQSCGDFELIVSNNSDLVVVEESVRRFGDHRVRYFSTGKTLPIDESYGFAVSHCRGEYITYLGDDDAYSKLYLERFREAITQDPNRRLLCCAMCDYYFDSITLNGVDIAGNTLGMPAFTNDVHDYPSVEVLKHVFRSAGLTTETGVKPQGTPSMLNAAYHHSIVDETVGRLGYLFPKIIYGDIFTLVASLSLVESYAYIDSPLAIHGFSKTSLTAIDSVERLKAFIAKNREYLKARHVPLSFYAPSNQMADNVLMARADMGGILCDIRLSLDDYFMKCLIDLEGLSLEGLDVREELKEFWQVLEEHDSALRDRMWHHSRKLTRTGYLLLNRAARRAGLYRMLKRIIRDRSTRFLAGRHVGFSNIAECGAAVNEGFLTKYASKV